jgi:hypothetical protein
MQSRRDIVLPQYHPASVLAAVQAVAAQPPDGLKTLEVDPLTWRAQLKSTASWRSPGETMTVQILARPAGGSIMQFTSRTALAAQVVDFGKAHTNVSRVAQAVVDRLERAGR